MESPRINYLKGGVWGRINAILVAAGYNFDLLLRWLAALFREPPSKLSRLKRSLKSRAPAFFTKDYAPRPIADVSIAAGAAGVGRWR